MIFAVVLVALSFPVLGKAQLFRWTYSRPMCRQQEACYYEAFGYKFQFCDCPNNANCPIDNDFFARSSQSVQYFFCEEPTMPVCENGDLSTTVTGLSTVVHCTCPDDMIMKEIPIENDSSEDDTVAIKSKDYICKKKPLCQADAICAQQTLLGKKFLCDCARKESCIPSSTTNPFASSYCK